MRSSACLGPSILSARSHLDAASKAALGRIAAALGQPACRGNTSKPQRPEISSFRARPDALNVDAVITIDRALMLRFQVPITRPFTTMIGKKMPLLPGTTSLALRGFRTAPTHIRSCQKVQRAAHRPRANDFPFGYRSFD